MDSKELAKLDLAIAKIEGYVLDEQGWPISHNGNKVIYLHCAEAGPYSPTFDWNITGPLIEKYNIAVETVWMPDGETDCWIATVVDEYNNQNEAIWKDSVYCPTPLIAICKAIKAAKGE